MIKYFLVIITLLICIALFKYQQNPAGYLPLSWLASVLVIIAYYTLQSPLYGEGISLGIIHSDSFYDYKSDSFYEGPMLPDLGQFDGPLIGFIYACCTAVHQACYI